MNTTTITVSADTPQWHEAFIRYVPRVFTRISFRGWYDLGGWDAGYRAFAVAAGDEIVASASVQRMTIVLRGCELTGWQLGAVGVVPQWRGKGLQRPIMERLLAVVAPGDLVFLFANDSVLTFYPKFGFRRVTEHVYGDDVPVQPATDRRLRTLSLTNAADRALVTRIATSALPVTRQFGARDYAGVLLWYWTNFYQDCFYYCAQDDAIIVAEQNDDALQICDVLGARPVMLPDYLPRIAVAPVSRLEFGFTPEAIWPQARVVREYTDSTLFVRGDFGLPTIPFKFPLLAQT